MHLYIQYLGVLALAVLFINSSSALDLDRRQHSTGEGNFTTTTTSTPTGSAMTTSDTGSSMDSSRMIFTSATSVQSASSTPHGPTAAGSTCASVTGGSSSGQDRAIGFSTSQFAVGIGAVAGFIAFNML